MSQTPYTQHLFTLVNCHRPSLHSTYLRSTVTDHPLPSTYSESVVTDPLSPADTYSQLSQTLSPQHLSTVNCHRLLSPALIYSQLSQNPSPQHLSTVDCHRPLFPALAYSQLSQTPLPSTYLQSIVTDPSPSTYLQSIVTYLSPQHLSTVNCHRPLSPALAYSQLSQTSLDPALTDLIKRRRLSPLSPVFSLGQIVLR